MRSRGLRVGAKRRCPVCRARVRGFDPLPAFYAQECLAHGFPYSLREFETLNVDAYGCPSCGSADRERLIALYLERKRDASPGREPLRLLDIAPVPWLEGYLRATERFLYRSADLHDELADDRVDITEMPYLDGSFDVVICSHVLEHVSDDRRALSELRRVLAPAGFGLLMVPICTALAGVVEDPGEADEGMRWRRFGQADHVRLYVRSGFVERVEAAGFNVECLDSTYFGRRAFATHGLSLSSVLYVVSA